jgi:hypothetical protein
MIAIINVTAANSGPVPRLSALRRGIGAVCITLALRLISLCAGYRVVTVPAVDDVIAEPSEAK